MKPLLSRVRRSVAVLAGLGLALSTSMAFANETSVAQLLVSKYPAIKGHVSMPHALPIPGLYEVTIASKIAYTNEKVDYLLVGGELLAGNGSAIRNITAERAATAAAASLPSAGDASVPATKVSSNASGIDPHVFDDPGLSAVTSQGAQPHGFMKVLNQESDAYNTLPFDKAIPLVYGKGERKLAMFADPDCPYCQAMEKSLNDRGAALNATVYVFLWPLTIHPHSNEKADYLWCLPDRSKAWESWMVFAANSDPKANEEDVWNTWKKNHKLPDTLSCSPSSPREEGRAIAEKYGFKYTPTLLFENGAMVSGGTSVQGLEKVWDYVYHGIKQP